MTKRTTRKTPRRGTQDRLTPIEAKALAAMVDLLNRSADRAGRALDDALRAVQRSNRRIEAMEKQAGRNAAQQKRSALERELLDYASKIIERQFAAMAKRVDQTNHRLDRLFLRLDRLQGKKRQPPAYDADDEPLTDRQVRAIRKRAAQGPGGGKKHRKVRNSLF